MPVVVGQRTSLDSRLAGQLLLWPVPGLSVRLKYTVWIVDLCSAVSARLRSVRRPRLRARPSQHRLRSLYVHCTAERGTLPAMEETTHVSDVGRTGCREINNQYLGGAGIQKTFYA